MSAKCTSCGKRCDNDYVIACDLDWDGYQTVLAELCFACVDKLTGGAATQRQEHKREMSVIAQRVEAEHQARMAKEYARPVPLVVEPDELSRVLRFVEGT